MEKRYYLHLTSKDHEIIKAMAEKAGISMKDSFVQGAKEYLQKKLKIDEILERETGIHQGRSE